MDPPSQDTVVDLDEARALRSTPTRMTGGLPEGDAARFEVLHQVALLVNSTLELSEVLHRIGALCLELSGAKRCSIFLLNGQMVEPVVAIGTRRDNDLWDAFREMGPIRRSDIPDAWKRLFDGGAIAIEDARTSNLVPTPWVERFDLRGLLLIPLIAGDERCGALALDYPAPRSFDPEELKTLDAVAASAATAVRNARLYAASESRAGLQEALANGIAALVSHDTAQPLAGALADAYADLLGVKVCAIGLFDAASNRVTTIAARGGAPRATPIPFTTIPGPILDRLTTTWSENPRRSVSFDSHPWFAEVAGLNGSPVDRYILLPIVAGKVPRGAVVIGVTHGHQLDDEQRTAARALADLAGAALERADLLLRLGRHARHMEVLYGVSSVIAEGADTLAIVERLNAILATESIEVLDINWRDPDLIPGGRSALTSDAEDETDLPETYAIPMHLGGRVVGELLVRADEIDEEMRAFLQAVGRGVAEVASRGALRSALERSTRDRAIAAERDRIADDLHDTVGSLFVAIGLSVNRALPRLPATSPWVEKLSRVADLAASGKWEIDQAVRALTFVPADGRGLPIALAELARSFEQDSGVRVVVESDGDLERVTPRLERALYRVTHEALINAWRHARCGLVHVGLRIDDERVYLSVRDDGVGLGPSRVTTRPGIGVASMRRVMDEIGGELTVRNATPRGVLVEALAPLPATLRAGSAP